MLRIENVGKTFAPGTVNQRVALRDITLHLSPASSSP